MSAVLLAASNPSPYWYLTRGLGTTALVALTATVVLGIGTSLRWNGELVPGFAVAGVHRNLSLFALLLVAAHVLTTVLDPFAHISLHDALVPFAAAYRPLWLGLGVAAAEVLVVVAATSLIRGLLGPERWKFVHWSAYGTWPLAVFHGLGTGTDARAPWEIAVVAACLAAVLLVGADRLLRGRLSSLPARLAIAITVLLALYSGTQWAIQGPFQTDWASRSGTPAALLKPPPVHPGNAGFSDPLAGVMVHVPGGATEVSLRDQVDTALVLAVQSPGPGQTLPVVTVSRSGKVLCQSPATATRTLYSVCGRTRIVIALYGPVPVPPGTSDVTGRLDTSGPLGVSS